MTEPTTLADTQAALTKFPMIDEARRIKSEADIQETHRSVEFICAMGWKPVQEDDGSYVYSHPAVEDTHRLSEATDITAQALRISGLMPLTPAGIRAHEERVNP